MPGPELLDQILPGNTNLRTLNLKILDIKTMCNTLRRLGNVKTLKRVSITVPIGPGADELSEIDSVLASIVGPQVEDVDMRLLSPGPNMHVDVVQTRRSLPTLDAKDILSMSAAAPWSFALFH